MAKRKKFTVINSWETEVYFDKEDVKGKTEDDIAEMAYDAAMEQNDWHDAETDVQIWDHDEEEYIVYVP